MGAAADGAAAAARTGRSGRGMRGRLLAVAALGLLVAVPATTADPSGSPTTPGPRQPAGTGAGGQASSGGAGDEPCPEAGARGPRPAPPHRPPPPLPPDAQAAVRDLSQASERLPCGAVEAWVAGIRGEGGGEGQPQGHGHGHGETVEPRPLSDADAAAFDRQWSAAVGAARDLASAEQASAAGYVRASSPVPGVGSHWIDWTLVDRPFDPTRPSMLLMEEPDGEPARLVAFSYWVRSPEAPEGFAGPNDVWHSHLGLCVINGYVYLEGVASRLGCPGNWLNGSDLWMLHAWVVPGMGNPDGPFAPAHPDLEAGGRG